MSLRTASLDDIVGELKRKGFNLFKGERLPEGGFHISDIPVADLVDEINRRLAAEKHGLAMEYVTVKLESATVVN